MKIRKLISAYKTKLSGQKVLLEERELLNKKLIVSVGTIPQKPDKDEAWFYALAQHHDSIYDIGSNVGYCSILASVQNPGKQIVIADPNPIALKQAKDNLERNKLINNKIFVNAFLSDKKGEKVKFYTLGSGAAGSMFGSHADSAKAVNAYHMVDTTTLDDIVNETGILPALVKVDVEAAESYVLNGAVKLAAHQKAIFMVEMHGPTEMPMSKNAELILDWCKRNKYTAWYMKEHLKLEATEQISHRGRCHVLLTPAGADYPDYLKKIGEGSAIIS